MDCLKPNQNHKKPDCWELCIGQCLPGESNPLNEITSVLPSHERSLRCKCASVTSPGGPGRAPQRTVLLNSDMLLGPRSWVTTAVNTRYVSDVKLLTEHPAILIMYKRLSYVTVPASAGWVSGWLFNEYLTYAHFGHFCSRSCQGESRGLPPSAPRELINTLRHRAGVCAAGAACGSLSQLPTGRGPGAVICFTGKAPRCSVTQVARMLPRSYPGWKSWGVPGPRKERRTEEHWACTQARPWSPATQLALQDQVEFCLWLSVNAVALATLPISKK